MRSPIHRIILLSFAIAASCALGTSLCAQCPTPDGLGVGPCCTSVTPDLPPIQEFGHESLGICWRDCDVEELRSYKVLVRRSSNAPFSPIGTGRGACDSRLVEFLLYTPVGKLAWRGRLDLTYSRTWVETDGSGTDIQVWRFLANGDLRPGSSAGLSPCPVPPCAAVHAGRARYTGYVDYARECPTGGFQFAWMLTHACDVLEHAPNFPRGGAFHPNRAYTFVGPSAGFTIGPIQPIVSGGTSLESVRRIRLSTGGMAGASRCEFEEQIDAGLDPQQELCLCGFPAAPGQYAISDLGLGSACGTSISSPGGPFLPGYVSMGIGAWTDASRYPGLETLRWTTGGYDYFDPCVGVTRQEVFHGVTTLGGYAASRLLPTGPGSPLPSKFVDQVNSLDRPGTGTIMNVPFRSDHVINLNFN